MRRPSLPGRLYRPRLVSPRPDAPPSIPSHVRQNKRPRLVFLEQQDFAARPGAPGAARVGAEPGHLAVRLQGDDWERRMAEEAGPYLAPRTGCGGSTGLSQAP